jgi:hypothetical protein
VIEATKERETNTMTTRENKPTRQDRLRKVLSGMQLHFTGITALTLAGVSHAVAELEKDIQDDIAATDATDKAHASLTQTVDAAKASHAAVDPLVSGVKQYVLLNWGNTEAASAVLADFGWTPRKKPVVKPATKVAAAGKAKATRTARGTKGPKQKAAIVAEPAAPAAEPAATEPAAPPAGGAPKAQ